MRFPLPLALLTLAGAIAAQGVVDSPLAGLPNAFSIDPTTYGPPALLLDSTRVYVKEVGFSDTAPPTPFAVSGKPDFSPGAMFPGVSPRPDIDAISIGLDWILANAAGEVQPPTPGGWGALTFSVSRGTLGAPGSVIRRETAGVDGVGADLFSYIFPGGVVPISVTDKVALVQDSREISLWDGVHKGEMDAHDVYMKLYDLDPAFLPFLPTNPTFYFSVTTATTGLVPPGWWGGTTPSGATILMTTWTGTAWTPPVPFRTYAAFGRASTEEIDAFAYDSARGYVLFSTKGTAPDEIMFNFLPSGPAGNSIYRFPGATPTPVSKRIELTPGDDVDAICALDPGRTSQIMRGVCIGEPRQQLLPGVPGQTNGSTFRRQLSFTGIAMVESWMARWPAPGPGVAVLFMQGPGTGLVSVFQTGRPPVSPFGGDPVRCQLQIPHSPSLLNLPLDFTWAAASLTPPQVFDVALPQRLWL